MNLDLFKRAIFRNRHMKDRPGYLEFLQHIDGRKGVWKASQLDVARWWERRQAAGLEMEVSGPGVLRVSCAIEDCVIEAGGERLEPAPVEVPVSSEIPEGRITFTYQSPSEDEAFLREVLGHLGYNHFVSAPGGTVPDIGESEYLPVLEDLREMAVVHQKFGTEDLERMRSLLRDVHHRKGIPDLRLWTLPLIGGVPARSVVSPRFDVDKAIINLPGIHRIESRFGIHSTVYLRPMGIFYGEREITRYARDMEGHEIALHGEFVTTAEQKFGDEFNAAHEEKKRLEEICGVEAAGLSIHGGELRQNRSESTYEAAEQAGFRYNTLFRNSYYHPLHLPYGDGMSRMLSIGLHYADIMMTPGPGFSERLASAFIERFGEAEKVGGVFVPVMHPLYFDLSGYLCSAGNIARLLMFLPKCLVTLGRMGKDQEYSNR
jgi:hypothetical protein